MQRPARHPALASFTLSTLTLFSSLASQPSYRIHLPLSYKHILSTYISKLVACYHVTLINNYMLGTFRVDNQTNDKAFVCFSIRYWEPPTFLCWERLFQIHSGIVLNCFTIIRSTWNTEKKFSAFFVLIFCTVIMFVAFELLKPNKGFQV